MKLAAVALFACMAFASVDSFAGNEHWMKINQSYISASYLDVHGLKRNRQGRYQYQVKTVPVVPRAIDEEFEKDDIGWVILHGEMDCSTDSYHETAIDIFSSTGAYLGSEHGQEKFKAVNPGTQEYNLDRILCHRDQK